MATHEVFPCRSRNERLSPKGTTHDKHANTLRLQARARLRGATEKTIQQLHSLLQDSGKRRPTFRDFHNLNSLACSRWARKFCELCQRHFSISMVTKKRLRIRARLRNRSIIIRPDQNCQRPSRGCMQLTPTGSLWLEVEPDPVLVFKLSTFLPS